MVTLARDLRRRKARERTGAFVAEGVRAVEELLRSSLTVRGVLVSPAFDDAALRSALEQRGVPITAVDERTFATAADTESPQGVLAVAEAPVRTMEDIEANGSGVCRVLALDGVQDPGNVGAIIRSAAAFGITATIALPGTVDLWNAKVVRSAMGAHFVHPAFAAPWEALDGFRAASGIPLWGADAGGTAIAAPYPARLVIVVGNEGNGLSAEARARADRLVSIPVRQVESLNVAVATGILLYELRV
ncbi:MAG TPA: RNA methyltransferase [Gemmatimonadaceae bacterium]|jgi:TrmH family RNA methyltransferase|nr:RNA methyltransferase [Gemmatimonadaceae bacterium]